MNRHDRIAAEAAARENERASRELPAEAGEWEVVDAVDGALATIYRDASTHVDEHVVREPAHRIQ